MATKFYIYKGHRWLELDLTTGTLEGTREKLRFLYVKDGTLRLARHSKILSGLRALQSGRPTFLVEGQSLQRRRRKVRRPRSRSPRQPGGHRGCSCVTNNDEVHSRPPPIIINNIQQSVKTSTRNVASPGPAPQAAAHAQTLAETDKTVSNVNEKPACQPKISEDDNDSSDSAESPVKELFIDEEDVGKIRDFLSENPKIFGDIDKERFDADDRYRNVLLFKLNPLVKIVKKGNLEERITKERIRTAEEMSQKEFVATLGLTHINEQPAKEKPAYRTRQRLGKLSKNNDKPGSKFHGASSSDSDDKENSSLIQNSKSAATFTNKDGRDSQRRDNEKERNAFKKKSMILGKMKAGKRSLSGIREYSSLEDHAIVAWVSAGGRDKRVNGNLIWRELSKEYAGITGLKRSWHSLRNRYLRYILPALGTLRLEPQHESKLRAAAAKGELKLRRKRSLNRRNSIHSADPVISAWARRPAAAAAGGGARSRQARRTRHSATTVSRQLDSSGDEYKPRKSHTASTKSPDQPSPVRKLRSSALSYSAITEAFSRRHQESSVGSGQASLPPSPPPATRPGRRLFNPKAI